MDGIQAAASRQGLIFVWVSMAEEACASKHVDRCKLVGGWYNCMRGKSQCCSQALNTQDSCWKTRQWKNRSKCMYEGRFLSCMF